MGKTARVVMCGLRKVGKTAVLEQLIYGNISKSTLDILVFLRKETRLISCPTISRQPVKFVWLKGKQEEEGMQELHSTIEDIYVANIETDRGTREKVRFYDICGLDQPLPNSPASRDQPQLPRQYFGLADGYVLVYDTDRPESLDALIALKKDIDRNREKKEMVLVVIGNRIKQSEVGNLENTASKAAHWAAREKIKHFEVNAMDRSTLFEPFVYLTSRLNPPPNKSSFPQLSMVRKSIGRPDTN
ncbi:NF-kappa-B inhibitor-interacting Ras-like protein 2 isoform X1 [Schistocerca piceifrons]|uniref:NF-kappa-B inhibitor-interacting Ras-like protein 2 isoform X1 n=1 Tax=Schistocerca piceifrons TaxID=274613 RepID=UPI001F5EBE91|nr:NF-kappa-B inhibitor-interacting Ras-like protein 2 isoform X1 [Schistocerca piceifrons]